METGRIFPDNWKEIIQGKKVILYNTGVTSLLQGREKRIEKMKWVFQIFKEQPEVVLWWRPHPLELSTVHSMLPELEEQYKEVRRKYEEENTGILDESADLNRAIAISDAYYGAWSSIVELYKATKKPVLYENNGVKRIDNASFLPIVMCIKNRFIWFIQLNSNKLVKVDRTTFEVEKIISIPFEPPFKNRLYNYHIIDTGNSLLLLLEKSKQIYEYEVETGLIKIHKPEVESFVFHSEVVVEKNGKLFMFPYDEKDILEYDYRTKIISKKKFAHKHIKVAKCCETIGTKIYMADKDSNTLYRYDMINNLSTSVNIGAKDNRYWGIKKAGKYFVLPHIEKKAVTLWDEENGETIELTEFPEQYMFLKDYAYLDMFENDGDIYIFPFYANMILKIDVENKVITQAFSEEIFKPNYEVGTENLSSETFLSAKRYQNYIYTYVSHKKCWQVFDLDAMSVKNSFLFEIKQPEQKEEMECILDGGKYEESFCEREGFIVCNLENYIKNLQKLDRENSNKQITKNNIGINIYESLKNGL